jgi:predicted kinase
MMPDINPRPTLTIISGRPGSGKTTLARVLAGELCCPLISRDDINEGIHRTYRHDVRHLAAQDKEHVAKLAFDAFFRTIQLLLAADVSLLAEAAFQDHRWRVGLAPLLPLADVKLVQCAVAPAVARQRIRDRRMARREEPVDPPPRAYQPLSLPVPSLRVDTGDGYEPALAVILAFITSAPPG